MAACPRIYEIWVCLPKGKRGSKFSYILLSNDFTQFDLRSIVKQVLATYINHSRLLNPDGINRHESMKEEPSAAVVPECKTSGVLHHWYGAAWDLPHRLSGRPTTEFVATFFVFFIKLQTIELLFM